jgi:hypothetical protein
MDDIRYKRYVSYLTPKQNARCESGCRAAADAVLSLQHRLAVCRVLLRVCVYGAGVGVCVRDESREASSDPWAYGNRKVVISMDIPVSFPDTA